MSALEECLYDKMVAAGFPEPTREYRFHKGRQWRIDFCFIDYKIAVEVEGGTFSRIVRCHHCQSVVMTRTKSGKFIPLRVGGRHNTGVGMEGDVEKYNALVFDGFMLVRITANMINTKSGDQAIEAIRTALLLRGWEGA